MCKKKWMQKAALALGGLILAGSMGWSQMSAQAAVNGEVICNHENAQDLGEETVYEARGLIGHIPTTYTRKYCPNGCGVIEKSSTGSLEAHDFKQHYCIEELDGGMYMHWIRCVTCGYEDEVLSDDPGDPNM